MTANAEGGPSSAGGQPFLRVGHGTYELRTEDARAAAHPSRSSRGERRSAKESVVATRVDALIEGFPRYLRVYDEQYPFRRSGQWSNHAATIQLRRALGSATAAARDASFVANLHQTLRSWGIGKRASRIVSVEMFTQALETHVRDLQQLEGLSIEDSRIDIDGVVEILWRFIETAPVVENRAKIVAGTKTLHHLLPDLVPPIDREWTGAFFDWTLNDFQSGQRRTFLEGFTTLHSVAVATRPSQYVGDGWRTSSSKLLDNALIGYMLDERSSIARAPSPVDIGMLSTAELEDLRDLIQQELSTRPDRDQPE
jgi:hypothetical protein